ncbi:MAG TPA: DUF4012 domain-containing protein [Mycobacteriales bacterium]|nr:DUF4012 domain-containing protein [Mycobacteriales bacterium]
MSSTSVPVRGRRRRTRHAVAAAVLLLLSALAWIGIRGMLARSALIAARSELSTAASRARDGDLSAAETAAKRARSHAVRAESLTGDVLWRLGASVPLVGDSLATTRDIAVTARVLAVKAMPPLLEALHHLDDATAGGGGSSIRLGGLTAALDPVVEGLGVVQQTQRDLTGRRRGRVLPQIAVARADLTRHVASLRDGLGELEAALRIAPEFLGSEGKRSYFLGFQTLAELRGTGGLIGSYAVLTADRGTLTLSRVGTTGRDLQSPYTPVVDLGKEFSTNYGVFAASGFWSNLNMSPHFPYTDQIARALWRRQFGAELDGTIALDSFALSHLLRTAGPITLPAGDVITADNVVDVTLRDAYLRFDEAGQDAFNLELADAAARKLLGGLDNPLATILALSRASADGHLQVAVRDQSVQSFFAERPIGGVLDGEPGPYLGLSLTNAGATKLDYYLNGEVTYQLDRRTGLAVAEVRFTNTVSPSALPRIGGTSIGGRAPGDPPAPLGRNRLRVAVYGGVGAALRGGSVDGVRFVQETSLPGQPWVLGDTRTLLEPGTERGRAMFSTFLDVDPGKPVVLRVEFMEVTRDGPLRTRLPPAVRPFGFRDLSELRLARRPMRSRGCGAPVHEHVGDAIAGVAVPQRRSSWRRWVDQGAAHRCDDVTRDPADEAVRALRDRDGALCVVTYGQTRDAQDCRLLLHTPGISDDHARVRFQCDEVEISRRLGEPDPRHASSGQGRACARVHGKDERQLLRQIAQRSQQVTEQRRVVDRRGPVHGDQPVGAAFHAEVGVNGSRLTPREVTEQRVHHGVADEMYLVVAVALVPEVVDRIG